jgi:hypothetical protein
MLNELNRMEQELTELFTGKVRTEPFATLSALLHAKLQIK